MIYQLMLGHGLRIIIEWKLKGSSKKIKLIHVLSILVSKTHCESMLLLKQFFKECAQIPFRFFFIFVWFITISSQERLLRIITIFCQIYFVMLINKNKNLNKAEVRRLDNCYSLINMYYQNYQIYSRNSISHGGLSRDLNCCISFQLYFCTYLLECSLYPNTGVL